jgi:NTP pyrophosphatase (non-canonical NTP hydrolase)
VAKYNLNQAIKDTKRVVEKMPNKKKWPVHARLAELVEEVGELANAIQTEEGYKTKKRQKSEAADSICDILFEILLISEIYKIDLDKEYPVVLKEIDERRKSGEFNF